MESYKQKRNVINLLHNRPLNERRRRPRLTAIPEWRWPRDWWAGLSSVAGTPALWAKNLSVSNTEPCGSYVVPSTKKEDRTGPLNTPSSHSHPSLAAPLHLPRNTQIHRLAGPSTAKTIAQHLLIQTSPVPREVQWARSDRASVLEGYKPG